MKAQKVKPLEINQNDEFIVVPAGVEIIRAGLNDSKGNPNPDIVTLIGAVNDYSAGIIEGKEYYPVHIRNAKKLIESKKFKLKK